MAKVVALFVEILEQETGLWCRDCFLGSGIRVTLAVRTGGALSLSSARRCVDCGGDQIDP